MKGNGKPNSIPENRLPITWLGDKKPGIVVDCEPIRGRKKVEFSVHALDQMEIRGITRDEVLRTIREPHKTGLPTQPNRKRFRRYRSVKKAIDVVFEEANDRVIIVTAMVATLRGKDQPADDYET
jgi:hypothetical protein